MVNSYVKSSCNAMSQKLKERIDYLLSKEKGTIYKDPGGKINIALVYPNSYHVGMSNLGLQGIYGFLNSMRDVVCERAFLPDDSDIDEYLRTDTELFSMESKRPLNRFDIIAFSVSFENDYPNILKILELSKIPSRSLDRGFYYPLIIMGGVCAFFNPEPVADFFDLCFIGEADEMLLEFLNIYRLSADKKDLLQRASLIDGIYVPQFYNIVYNNDGKILQRENQKDVPSIIRRRYIKNLSESRIRFSIITPEAEFSEMYLIELMRGCPWSCRFCVSSKVYYPPRKKDSKIIEDEIRVARNKTNRIGLIGPSLTDYPDITKILQMNGVDFSITSLRASKKSAELISFIKDHKSVSIAPEAGTERLRKVINKRISDEDILNTAELLFSSGIETLRLYFMVGLPTETINDIEGIVNLVKKIADVPKRSNITLSISTFVPKPFTPFQWHNMEEQSEVKKRLKIIKKNLQNLRGVKVFHDIPKYSYMQGVFSLGDRRVSKIIEQMLKTEDWIKAAEVVGIDVNFYIFRKKEFQEFLPWEFIDIGISKEELWKEYKEALSP